jgi:hypothetical protein
VNKSEFAVLTLSSRAIYTKLNRIQFDRITTISGIIRERRALKGSPGFALDNRDRQRDFFCLHGKQKMKGDAA